MVGAGAGDVDLLEKRRRVAVRVVRGRDGGKVAGKWYDRGPGVVNAGQAQLGRGDATHWWGGGVKQNLVKMIA